MATPLPALRRGLDLMPSPFPERPGLLLRDPYRYSETVLILPPPLAPLLALFDGERTELDLRAALVRMTGEIEVGPLLRHLHDSLSGNGFLEDEVFVRLREERQRAFAAAPRREAAHAGSAYAEDPGALSEALSRHLDPAALAPAADGLIGIAAPHVSFEGGWPSYQAAYGALGRRLGERTFAILGTSHYGEPERFGLTRKAFATPLGETTVDAGLVERLARAGGAAVQMEDYCHAVEHSIEFQVLLLQHLYGPGVRILPVLCGPFARGVEEGVRPDDDPGVARFIEALAGLAADEAERVFWVLGVDMAHLGRRYGDPFRARADSDRMAAVAKRDRLRIARVLEGDAQGFWELVREAGDPLRWCGASPLYTFLAAVRPAAGELLRYGQWNIDDGSVVSFAGLAFRGVRQGAS